MTARSRSVPLTEIGVEAECRHCGKDLNGGGIADGYCSDECHKNAPGWVDCGVFWSSEPIGDPRDGPYNPLTHSYGMTGLGLTPVR